MGFISDLFGGAERDAAQFQAQASDRAINELRNTDRFANIKTLPFRQVGERILDPLFDFVNRGPETDLQRSQGFDDISKSAAARGKLASGDTLKELTTFNNRLNADNRNQRFSELFNLAQLGSNAATNSAAITANIGGSIADTIIGKGDALAAGRIGSANRRNSALQGIGSFIGSIL